MIRVVLVDDQITVRRGLRMRLTLESDITVIGEASTGREAMALVQQLCPDVVLMDIEMPDMDGITTTAALQKNERKEAMYTNYDPNQNYNPYAQEQSEATVPAISSPYAQGQSYAGVNASANYDAYGPQGANAYAPPTPSPYGSAINSPEYPNAWPANPPVSPYIPGPGGATMSPPAVPRRRSGLKVLLVVLGGVLAMMCVIGGLGAVLLAASASSTTPSSSSIQQRSATVVAQTHATATAAATSYPFSAVLKLDDPLTDNSRGYGWEEDSGCAFTSGAYHVTNTQAKTYYTCSATNTDFSNFTYQVSMQIAQGDGGALTFRGDVAHSKFYSLLFDTTGSYTLLLYTGQSANARTLTSGTAPAFHTGLGQTNVIGVVAKGDKIAVYVNGQIAGALHPFG